MAVERKVVFAAAALAALLPQLAASASPLDNDYTLGIVLAADLVSVLFCILTIWLGMQFIKDYGGAIGRGLRFILAGIGLVGLSRLFDFLSRGGLDFDPATRIDEALVKNILTVAAMSLALYGMWKMRTPRK